MQELEKRFGAMPDRLSETLTVASRTQIAIMDLAIYLDEILPDGREKSLAFTELETCGMWAAKTATRGETNPAEVPYEK